MFPVGRQTAASTSSLNADAEDNDWLSVGKSFSGDKREPYVSDSSAFASQVCTSRQCKRKDEKKMKKSKEKKRRRKELTKLIPNENGSLSKPKKKSKSKKRSRSWNREHSPHLSIQRSRISRSRSYNRDKQMRPDFAKDIVAYGQEAKEQEDKLFEFDCDGDRENLFFGSTYVNDQPIYQLATGRDLLTGTWVTQVPLKHTSCKILEENLYSGRYFSQLARKMQTNGRQKRLFLAYSEKRQARAGVSDQLSCNQQDQTASKAVSPQHEMTFIPLDSALDSDELSCTYANSKNDDAPLLTNGQSVEQYLMEHSKRLNAAVHANPHSIDHWLDLIAFQEETIYLHTETKKMTSAMKSSIVKKQAAILAKAIDKNRDSQELHRVKLNMSLQALAHGDDSDLDAFQWQLENQLAEDLTNSELWLKLLRCRHQRFGTFSMQSVRDLYARTLTVLRTHSASTSSETAACLASGLSEKMKAVEGLSITLLDFHFLMCLFEKKTGYVERSIAQLQALFAFNMMLEKSDSNEEHLDMLQKFAMRWNDPGTIRLGEKCYEIMDLNIGVLGKNPPELSIAAFQDFITKNCVTTMDQVNPPAILRSEVHKQKLLSSVYDQQSSRTKESLSSEDSIRITNEIDSNSIDSAEVDDVEMTHSSTFVYSNLHGYRITIDKANDVKKYERILSELRGTEYVRARLTRLAEKEKRRRAALTAAQVQIEDQRANYDPVKNDDRFVQWLMHEEVKMQTEWAPLLCNNPLIEQQPERAILTEEIQPFLFAIPKAQHWRLVAELLHICGLNWRGEHSWQTCLPACESMYADNCTEYELFVAPIQAALDPQRAQCRNSTLFISPSDRVKLLENALLRDISVKAIVLRDPSKVAFIRRIFAQALEIFHDSDDNFESKLKCLWVGFEATVARTVAEHKESALAYCRRLSQHLAQKSENGDTDFDVVHAYAKLELALGNKRHVRYICENTLASLGNRTSYDASLARIIHRFVFLHSRLEMWPSSYTKETKTRVDRDLRMLRCLYTLWTVWQPAQSVDKEKETLDMIAKKHQIQTKKYLQELLMLDSSIETTLIARYRDELKLAFEHCAASNLAKQEQGKSKLLSHDKPSCWVGYCLHNLALVIYAYHGFEAACQEVRKALAHDDHRTCPQLAWAWTCLLDFMQQHQASGSFPILAPRQWRLSVSEAVETFPFNELFLRLFVDSEMGNTISHVHRQYFGRVEKRWRRHYDSPKLVEWLFALLCEFCRSERTAIIRRSMSNDDNATSSTCCLRHHWEMNTTAINRVRHIFENMVNQIETKGNALCWGLYMRFEIALGMVDAARKVLYRGIAACAWSKALYIDGLRVMRAYLNEDECQELIDFMEAKELNVRVERK
ncbi:hypothetical protein PsorP6_008435 [Peronosclerospora sorghi]|uniref:Uncharacterized protein n=1 Tax=Peronosclerospora sorghi TaxID=230839 RepID=A0ACC0W886_9STRA|nr:hypothetical protein PsorP6_008435 [Peronosclerospora sorghi]